MTKTRSMVPCLHSSTNGGPRCPTLGAILVPSIGRRNSSTRAHWVGDRVRPVAHRRGPVPRRRFSPCGAERKFSLLPHRDSAALRVIIRSAFCDQVGDGLTYKTKFPRLLILHENNFIKKNRRHALAVIT